jgi:hypothetical protein
LHYDKNQFIDIARQECVDYSDFVDGRFELGIMPYDKPVFLQFSISPFFSLWNSEAADQKRLDK